MILCIETATGVCSVALCDDYSVISVLEAPDRDVSFLKSYSHHKGAAQGR